MRCKDRGREVGAKNRRVRGKRERGRISGMKAKREREGERKRGRESERKKGREE